MLQISAVRTNSPHEALTEVHEEVVMILSYLVIEERTTELEITGGKFAEATLRPSNSDSRKPMAERKPETAEIEEGVRLRFYAEGDQVRPMAKDICYEMTQCRQKRQGLKNCSL